MLGVHCLWGPRMREHEVGSLLQESLAFTPSYLPTAAATSHKSGTARHLPKSHIGASHGQGRIRIQNSSCEEVQKYVLGFPASPSCRRGHGRSVKPPGTRHIDKKPELKPALLLSNCTSLIVTMTRSRGQPPPRGAKEG